MVKSQQESFSDWRRVIGVVVVVESFASRFPSPTTTSPPSSTSASKSSITSFQTGSPEYQTFISPNLAKMELLTQYSMNPWNATENTIGTTINAATSTAFYNPSSPEIIMISYANAVAKISTAVGTVPEVKGYSPMNKELYVYLGSSMIALTATNTIAGTIGVTGLFLSVYNPTSTDMYFSSFTSPTTAGKIVVVSPSNSIVNSITVGVEPTFVMFDPANNDIYVTNAGSNTTSVISSSNSLITRIKDGQIPVLLMYNPKDGTISGVARFLKEKNPGIKGREVPF